MKKLFIALSIFFSAIQYANSQGSWNVVSASSGFTNPFYATGVNTVTFKVVDGSGNLLSPNNAYSTVLNHPAYNPPYSWVWKCASNNESSCNCTSTGEIYPQFGSSNGIVTANPSPSGLLWQAPAANQGSSTAGATTPAISFGDLSGTETTLYATAFLEDANGNEIGNGNANVFNVIGQINTGSGGPTATASPYCDFALAPPSYDPSGNAIVPYANVVDFPFGTTQNISSFPIYAYIPNPYPTTSNTPSIITYALTPPLTNTSAGWSFAYTSTPGLIKVLPPTYLCGNAGGCTLYGTLSATGTGGCASSESVISLKADYPTDSITHNPIDTTHTPIFSNPTSLIISSQTNAYDLKSSGYIDLIANLTCDHSNFVTIDWYEVDNTGKETLVAQDANSITVKVVGDYLAKVNLNQGATINPTTGAVQNYSGSNYYIAQSNIKEVYNSSSSTPNVDSMGVYPNPACGTLHVNYLLSGKVTSASLIITNLTTGATVLQESLYTTQQTQSVNISSLANGTYVATVEVNGASAGSISQTFVVMCGY